MKTPFIGWDVIYTDEGPKILEANLNWSIEAWQFTHDDFNKKFLLDLIEYHVRKHLNE
jgi:hypothetical protein